MNTVSSTSPQQASLFAFNRERLRTPALPEGPHLDFEAKWMGNLVRSFGQLDMPQHLADLLSSLDAQIQQEATQQPESSAYVAAHMTRDEFKILVQEFVPDGLTEAQVFYFILPRLSLAAQMPMLRIMIDEFGSGNLQRAHTTLYIALLRELGMATTLAAHCPHIEPTSFAFVNFFFWLTLRADDPSYFAGAITYLESAIPSFFACYVEACERLHITAHDYYSEHRHIDVFHAREGRRLLQAMNADQTLDVSKAWAGIQMASHITAEAFEVAVAKARRQRPSPSTPHATQREILC